MQPGSHAKVPGSYTRYLIGQQTQQKALTAQLQARQLAGYATNPDATTDKIDAALSAPQQPRSHFSADVPDAVPSPQAKGNSTQRQLQESSSRQAEQAGVHQHAQQLPAASSAAPSELQPKLSDRTSQLQTPRKLFTPGGKLPSHGTTTAGAATAHNHDQQRQVFSPGGGLPMHRKSS